MKISKSDRLNYNGKFYYCLKNSLNNKAYDKL